MEDKIIDVKHGGKFDMNWRNFDHRFMCCKCGLVHRLRFSVAGEMLRIRVWDDEVYERDKAEMKSS